MKTFLARSTAFVLVLCFVAMPIWATCGQKERALELQKRHFYKYERYHEVRTKEMMEARVDFMFNSIRHDANFMALTKHADGRLPMVMSPKAAEQMKMNDQ